MCGRAPASRQQRMAASFQNQTNSPDADVWLLNCALVRLMLLFVAMDCSVVCNYSIPC